MIIGDGVMLVVAAVLAAASWRWGTPLALLLTAGLVIGTVDAFYLPSSGSMPRLLVEDASLPRALALRQSGSQIVSTVVARSAAPAAGPCLGADRRFGMGAALESGSLAPGRRSGAGAEFRRQPGR